MIDNRQASYRPGNSSCAPIPCKKDLLRRIHMVSFAMLEANLYLDTHPNDSEALAYFQRYREERHDALKDYAKHYGPMTTDYAIRDYVPWNWTNEPWPWQGGDC